MQNLKKQKQLFRKIIKDQRSSLSIYKYIDLNKQVFTNFVSFFNNYINNKTFLNSFILANKTNNIKNIKDLKIALYYPINFETNTLHIMQFLNNLGINTMLPKVLESTKTMIFNKVNYLDIINFNHLNANNLSFNKYGILESQEKVVFNNKITDTTIPDIIIAPLLGFDEHGNRLGYGGGYYDSTLWSFNKLKKILYVGLAFEGEEIDDDASNNINQKFTNVPHNTMDYKFNIVVSNKKVYYF